MTIEELFLLAAKSKASDIHIIVGMPPYLRIDGKLQPIKGYPKVVRKVAESLILGMLTQKQRDIYLADRELDLSYEVKDLYRFRVNIHWEKGNPGLVARVIPQEVPTMEQITMPEIVYELIKLDQGLILITGPTGCGKSTALAAMINQINKERSAHIVTLEDPIEFIFRPNKSIIKQRQLHTDMNSFNSALIRVLRQDPNVIMVGEMRDKETIAATITIAETGHLVLATLHTHNAAQTMDRIIDIFPPYQQPQIRLQLSMTLRGVVSQRLIPALRGGRIATREIMINTPAVANLIRENKMAQLRSVIQTSAEEGMYTMDQDLARLVKERVISKETAEFYMMNPETLD